MAILILFSFYSSLIPPASAASATYIALGDSISTGYGLSDKDNDLFVNKLAAKTEMQQQNLAVEGLTTKDMLIMLSTLDSYNQTAISNASLITLSIGGDNLLKPLISTLTLKLGKELPTASRTEIIVAIASLLMDSSAIRTMQGEMTTGVLSFASDFPQIITAIKTLNPNATIVVQTIYNPLDKISGLENFSSTVDTILGNMNTIIMQTAAMENCKVADVYTAFKSSNTNGGSLLTNMASGDIHTNSVGNNVIYMSNYMALTGELPYRLTGTVANGIVSVTNVPGSLNVLIAVTADSGYKPPQSVNVSIGGQSQMLPLINGQAVIPASYIDGDIVITGSATTSTTAIPTKSSILLNGAGIAFEAYNIDGNNYFKLRDLAKALNGTDKQFEVNWDASRNAVRVTTGKAYTSVGGELAGLGSTTNKTAAITTAKVYFNDKEASITAYNIGGNNFFKLRDIATVLNFGVIWVSTTNTIEIDTTTGYSAG